MANLILDAVKSAMQHGEAVVNLKEASALTGSGSGIGGQTIFDDAFASLRQNNPIRNAGARIINTIGSDQAFVAKTGNITNIQNGSNPWGYSPINNNNATTGLNTVYWQLPLRAIQAVVPIRTAVMSDINNLEGAIVTDIALEFAQQEALSMMLNSDQSGSTTTNYGATVGLRGLNSYAHSTSAASFGTSGNAITNGIHTVYTTTLAGTSDITNADLAEIFEALPPQYLLDPTCCWMMHPSTLSVIRKTAGGTGLLLDQAGEMGNCCTYLMGKPVCINPYMDELGAGKYPIYFSAWEQFVTIADNELMKIQMFEQTQAGFITIFAEKRVCSTIRDVFAGVTCTKA